MNLPRGYSNLSILSAFFHESRAVTVDRAKRGQYRTAKPFKKNKIEAWIISTEELLEIMMKHQEPVPTFTGFITLAVQREALSDDIDTANNQLVELLTEMCQAYDHVVDVQHPNTNCWVEENEEGV